MRKVENLEKDIREILGEILERNGDDIPLEAKLIEDLGMDSMMALEILATLEKKFRVKLPEDELPQLTTLGKIIEFVKEHLK